MGDATVYLRLDGIHKTFGKFTALQDISLEVRRGELMVFLGPSGCGKTTLLRIVAGLESQDRGRIVQDGKDITRLPAIQRDYGIVFQSYALFPNLTIHDNVAYGLVNRRQSRAAIKARVTELLKLVGLPDAGSKYPGQLSGGQQQRIAVARALASAPGLLLLDEPLSALDALERVRLRGELRALQQRLSVTTVMVTHDQEEALSIADRIVVMHVGRIEQVGTPREIYEFPATPFVADFVGKINVLPAIAEGGGSFRVGSVSVASACRDVAAGTPVKLYLRPEEITVSAAGPSQGARAPSGGVGVVTHAYGAINGNSFPATVARIEFLGAFCMVGISLDAAGAPPLVANVSRQVVDATQLALGQPVTVSLPPSALRVLG